MKPIRSVGLVATLALCGCSTAPLTIINDRQVYYPVDYHRYPVRVEAVDRRGNIESPVFVDPGVHQVTLAAPPQRGFLEPVEKTYTLNLAPCTRYYVAAERATALTRDWNLVIEEQEHVAGCDPAKEWQKAGVTDPGSRPAPSSGVIISG
jgi:hypothetical protein